MPATDTLIVNSHCVEDTLALGERIGRALVPGSVIALIGTLGSGKTHLVKGIAQGNAVPETVAVTSPTFVLVNEYPGRIYLRHIDVYRLRGPADLAALGFDEMISAGGAVIVEWADRVNSLLPDDHLRIAITISGETDRHVDLQALGPLAAETIHGMRCG